MNFSVSFFRVLSRPFAGKNLLLLHQITIIISSKDLRFRSGTFASSAG